MPSRCHAISLIVIQLKRKRMGLTWTNMPARFSELGL
jgi:hypothetical protein